MDSKLATVEIKRKIAEKTDRIMWFSMWFLTAVATFGLAFFPMFYLLVERRNRHFSRQRELESLLIAYFKLEDKILQEEEVPARRNSLLWAASIVFVFPAFIIAYLLSKDITVHDRRQRLFFQKLGVTENAGFSSSINIRKCLLITVLTLGLGIIYWLNKIFNSYNSHFKEQWMVEDKLIKLIEQGEKINDHAGNT
ncbi:MAG: hypothetical protein N3F10_04300 [Candidatus Bathyarchaeota archaeon]|nr:hypothetical protein [Candidatus Bathyarchaeota archaeon]